MNQARMASPPPTSVPSVRRDQLEAAGRPGAVDLGAKGSGRWPRRWSGSVLKPWPHAATFNPMLRGIEFAGVLRSSRPGQRVSPPGSSPIEQRFATPRKGQQRPNHSATTTTLAHRPIRSSTGVGSQSTSITRSRCKRSGGTRRPPGARGDTRAEAGSEPVWITPQARLTSDRREA